jgi:hypothetical protein
MSCGKKAIWMQDMFGAYKVKLLKIQNSYIGKHKMMVPLFLIILSISVQKRINKNYLNSVKKSTEEMISYKQLIALFSVLRLGWKAKDNNFLFMKNLSMKKLHNLQYKLTKLHLKN